MLMILAMLESIDKMLDSACGFLWGYILIFALLGTHLYLTFLLRFPQRHLFTGLRLYFGGKGEGQISQFSSLMISLAANVGTGNIVGVAVTTGGPGGGVLVHGDGCAGHGHALCRKSAGYPLSHAG